MSPIAPGRARLSRRQFTSMVTAGLGALAVLRPRAATRALGALPAEQRLLSRFAADLPIGHPPPILGKWFLRVHPEALAELRALARALNARIHEPPEEVLGWLRRRRRRDFATGNLVMVDGWLLSITEARAFALLAIAA